MEAALGNWPTRRIRAINVSDYYEYIKLTHME
jgi:hypothetical protein